MPDTAPRILIAGSLTRDRIRLAKSQTEVTGGVVWHAGRTLAALGTAVTVVTRTAPDDRVLLNPLIEDGVHVIWEPANQTTTLVLSYDPHNPDARTVDVEALAEAIRAESLSEAMNDPRKRVDLVYLGPVHQNDLAADCIGVIGEDASVRVALDAQGLLRQQSGRRLVAGCSPDLDQWLAVIDVVKVSEGEARTLLGEATKPSSFLVTALAETLAGRLRGREVVMTCGLEGAWTWHEGTVSHATAQPVPGDPTGAGDLFFAAYLARRCAGDSCDTAARLAAGHVARRLARRAASRRP